MRYWQAGCAQLLVLEGMLDGEFGKRGLRQVFDRSAKSGDCRMLVRFCCGRLGAEFRVMKKEKRGHWGPAVSPV